MSQSEVARLLEQIDQECEAAKRGLSGLASGTACHDFIRARYQQLGVYQEQLARHIGAEQASHLLFDRYIAILEQ